MAKTLLDYHRLSIGVVQKDKKMILTRDVSFSVKEKEVFALVGESGSGKSITALAALALFPQPGGFCAGGSVHFKGENMLKKSEAELQDIRSKDIGMIFQEPGAALNPLMIIRKQLLEVFDCHAIRVENPMALIRDKLDRVGFRDIERVLYSYPHELSGGMQQRAMIAMALLLNPSLLIADEPTTALDVTIQAQVMDLLLDLQKDTGMAILFITHNLGLVAQYADRLAVMQRGEIVEQEEVRSGLKRLRHPYSRELLRAVPQF